MNRRGEEWAALAVPLALTNKPLWNERCATEGGMDGGEGAVADRLSHSLNPLYSGILYATMVKQQATAPHVTPHRWVIFIGR